MELLLPICFPTPPHASPCSSSQLGLNRCLSYLPQFPRRWSRLPKLPPLRLSSDLGNDFFLNEETRNVAGEVDSGSDDDPEFFEVIGIGSRRDAVLDYCLGSPFLSPSLRFWNIVEKDLEVLLQQRFLARETAPRVVEGLVSLQPSSKATILVAGAAYGSDHLNAIEILKKARSVNGLGIALIMKPFGFEGQRRQDEVVYLVDKLQEHANFYIVIDMDGLLQNSLVTLDEALNSANNAVSLALNAISMLISEKPKKYMNVPKDSIKELQVSHFIDLMQGYKEAKVGFGAGYSIETSVMQAIYDCPFLNVNIKDLTGTVVCVLASSVDVSSSDIRAFFQTFHQTTKCPCEFVLSATDAPNLEPNLIISTVFILGSDAQQNSRKRSIFASLAKHFPIFFNLLWDRDQGPDRVRRSYSDENLWFHTQTSSPDSVEMPKRFSLNGKADSFSTFSEELGELQSVLSSNSTLVHASRGLERNEAACLGEECRFSRYSSQNSGAFQREPLTTWNSGADYQIKQQVTEQVIDRCLTPIKDNPTAALLPIGIKLSEDLEVDAVLPNMSENIKQLRSSTSTRPKKKFTDVPKKQGVLSVRAASMLDAERDSEKRWNQIVEIEYQGGFYRGRCQGGLPEGKGCLSLEDGSKYEGMWRSGKKAGLGTFYYDNGDVFQGSWRDNVIHGKGWFYFNSGDRLFANFWKGKAHGEGRFYSRAGDVFFGHFQNGWRHGHFLCINVNGVRFVELWHEGVLVSYDQLDSDRSD